MNTKYAVVVPTTFKDFKTFKYRDLTRYFAAREVPLLVYLNGAQEPSAIGYLEGEDYWVWAQSHLQVPPTLCFGGTVPNPYVARNVAMLELFSGYGYWKSGGKRRSIPPVEAVFLTDLDCTPQEGLHEAVLDSIASRPNTLVGGRVTTSIPEINSAHFSSLREAGFECYDGFTPKGGMLGASMLITSGVFNKLGTFSTTNMSGGDTDYAIRASLRGVDTFTDERMWVSKTIYSMTLKGILEKQVRRGACCCRAIVPPLEHLESEIASKARALAASTNYQEKVDSLMGLQFLLGQLSQHMDEVKP